LMPSWKSHCLQSMTVAPFFAETQNPSEPPSSLAPPQHPVFINKKVPIESMASRENDNQQKQQQQPKTTPTKPRDPRQRKNVPESLTYADFRPSKKAHQWRPAPSMVNPRLDQLAVAELETPVPRRSTSKPVSASVGGNTTRRADEGLRTDVRPAAEAKRSAESISYAGGGHQTPSPRRLTPEQVSPLVGVNAARRVEEGLHTDVRPAAEAKRSAESISYAGGGHQTPSPRRLTPEQVSPLVGVNAARRVEEGLHTDVRPAAEAKRSAESISYAGGGHQTQPPSPLGEVDHTNRKLAAEASGREEKSGNARRDYRRGNWNAFRLSHRTEPNASDIFLCPSCYPSPFSKEPGNLEQFVHARPDANNRCPEKFKDHMRKHHNQILNKDGEWEVYDESAESKTVDKSREALRISLPPADGVNVLDYEVPPEKLRLGEAYRVVRQKQIQIEQPSRDEDEDQEHAQAKKAVRNDDEGQGQIQAKKRPRDEDEDQQEQAHGKKCPCDETERAAPGKKARKNTPIELLLRKAKLLCTECGGVIDAGVTQEGNLKYFTCENECGCCWVDPLLIKSLMD